MLAMKGGVFTRSIALGTQQLRTRPIPLPAIRTAITRIRMFPSVNLWVAVPMAGKGLSYLRARPFEGLYPTKIETVGEIAEV